MIKNNEVYHEYVSGDVREKHDDGTVMFIDLYEDEELTKLAFGIIFTTKIKMFYYNGRTQMIILNYDSKFN